MRSEDVCVSCVSCVSGKVLGQWVGSGASNVYARRKCVFLRLRYLIWKKWGSHDF